LRAELSLREKRVCEKSGNDRSRWSRLQKRAVFMHD
jgi:hypothetical protein